MGSASERWLSGEARWKLQTHLLDQAAELLRFESTREAQVNVAEVVEYGRQLLLEEGPVHPSVRDRSRRVVQDVRHEVESSKLARHGRRVDGERAYEYVGDLLWTGVRKEHHKARGERRTCAAQSACSSANIMPRAIFSLELVRPRNKHSKRRKASFPILPLPTRSSSEDSSLSDE